MKKILNIFSLLLILVIGSCAKVTDNKLSHHYKGKSKKCSTCNGKGKIKCAYCLSTLEPDTCPKCYGRLIQTCPDCDGTGEESASSDSDSDK